VKIPVIIFCVLLIFGVITDVYSEFDYNDDSLSEAIKKIVSESSETYQGKYLRNHKRRNAHSHSSNYQGKYRKRRK
jgi:hypothetical protein